MLLAKIHDIKIRFHMCKNGLSVEGYCSFNGSYKEDLWAKVYIESLLKGIVNT